MLGSFGERRHRGCETLLIEPDRKRILLLHQAPDKERDPFGQPGFVPVQRNTFYEPLRVCDGPAPADPGRATACSPILQQNLATA